MIDYLKKYLSLEEFRVIELDFSTLDKYNFDENEYNVIRVLDYLKSIGVVNFKDLLLDRKDICFKDLDVLKEEVSKIRQELIVKIFNEDVSSLSNLNI